MIPASNKPIAQLPIVPAAVLAEHDVQEGFDNRFRACARLLQSLWRQRQDLPSATYKPRVGRGRRLGSMLAKADAEGGRNFLTPRIAELARLEVAYREPNAMIDEARLFGNLLSSMPMCANLFGPLWDDRKLAARILRRIIPGINLKAVREVRFEHSPGRQDPALTGDRTAFDIAFVYERSDGGLGLVGIETKYSESCEEPTTSVTNPRHDEIAQTSGMFVEPTSAALRSNPVQQLFREHLLAQAAVDRGDYAEAWFVLIAPRLNHLVQNAARYYAGSLLEPSSGQVPFVNVTLEEVIAAYRAAGQADHASALHDRYTDWWLVDAVIRDAIKAQAGPKPGDGQEAA